MKKYRLLLLFTIVPLFLFTIYSLNREYKSNLENTATVLSGQSIFEDIYFSFEDKYLQKINLYKPEYSDSFHAYIPAASTTPLRIYFSHCKYIAINEMDLSNGDLLPSITPEVPYHIQILNSEKEVVAEDYITFYFSGTLPVVYITTESGNMDQVNNDKEYKESATYAVYTLSGTLDSSGSCNIKGRGNTSWSVEQKPYNLNLTSSTSILDMDSTSDWALLSNFGDDFPQLKNKLVFELANEFNLPYTPQSEFVHLYLNGQYNGLYLLTQRISVNDGTVRMADLDVANQQENGIVEQPRTVNITTPDGLIEQGVYYKNNPDNISGGYLLEFDARYEDSLSHFTTPRQDISIKSPKKASQQQVAYIANYVRNLENALFSDDGINVATDESYLDYIDMDSWSKIYTLHNYFVQWDVEFSSFYFYKQMNDPLLYAGPVWDFDLSCGKMYLGDYPKLSQHLLWIQDTKSIWLHQLSQHEDFLDYTTQQYVTELSSSISTLLETEFNNIVSPLISAFIMDSIRWNKGDVSPHEETDKLYSWLVERQQFLDAYYRNPDNYYAVTFAFAWGAVPYYVEKNTALEFLPYDAYGEKEKFASLYGFERITGWRDEDGNEISANDIITKDITYYPIYQYAE